MCVLLEDTDASCPILPRWLMPLPDVAELTGQSLTWLDAPSMPSEEELLHGFLARSDTDLSPSPTDGVNVALPLRAGTLLDMAGLRGAVMVLDHAGHGNYLGLQSSLTDDGAPGHDLRADHEALFMQVAAFGVTATLLGTAAAIPELWPSDAQREPFLQTAVDLAADVTTASVAIHRLGNSRRPPRAGQEAGGPATRKGRLAPACRPRCGRPTAGHQLRRCGDHGGGGVPRLGAEHADQSLGLRAALAPRHAGLRLGAIPTCKPCCPPTINPVRRSSPSSLRGCCWRKRPD